MDINDMTDEELKNNYNIVRYKADRDSTDAETKYYLNKEVLAYAREHNCTYDDAYTFLKTGEKTGRLIKQPRNKCRLIALDMDGTLLRKDKSLHPGSARDIAKAAKAGIHVVYSSGRSVAEILPYVPALKPMRYAVCMSGALVYDFKEKCAIYRKAVEQKYVLEIAAEAVRADAMLHLLTEEASVVSAEQVTHMKDFHMGPYQPSYLQTATLMPDMTRAAEQYEAVEKVNIYYRNEEDRRRGYERLKSLPLTFAFAEETSLEMNAEGVTKAAGLFELTKHLGIKMEETVGIGDGENDRAMLEAVGFSIAMGNAEDAIRRLCDKVTADNEHNGAGKAIRRWCIPHAPKHLRFLH